MCLWWEVIDSFSPLTNIILSQTELSGYKRFTILFFVSFSFVLLFPSRTRQAVEKSAAGAQWSRMSSRNITFQIELLVSCGIPPDVSISNAGNSRVGTIGGFILRETVIFSPSVVWIVAPVVIFTCISFKMLELYDILIVDKLTQNLKESLGLDSRDYVRSISHIL